MGYTELEQARIIKLLMEVSDVKNNNEVRSAFGNAISSKQLLLKMLLEGVDNTRVLTVRTSPDNFCSTIFITVGDNKFAFTTTYAGTIMKVDNLKLSAYWDKDKSYHEVSDLVIYSVGIFERVETQVGELFQCEGEVLKPYFSSAETEPLTNTPVHLFI